MSVYSSYSALVTFKEEKNKENILRGIVSHVDATAPVLTLSGRCGSKIYIEFPDKTEQQLFVDIESVAISKIQYFPVRIFVLFNSLLFILSKQRSDT
jgi:hypothetical protein